MITTDQIQELLNNGGTVVGSNGEKIGKIGEVYLDDQTGNPEWVTAKTGLFGTSETFVPLSEATISGDTIAVPYDKETVKDAPRMENADGHLSPEGENDLYQYYGLANNKTQDAQDHSDAPRETSDAAPMGHARDHSADDSMTRSEEQLRVGTETVESGKARLRKYVVTEDVTTTVPVSHEEVRLEREPITDTNQKDARSGGELSSDEHEVTLHAEQAVVDKETVPVERVRLETETVTGEQQINEEVSKEQFETEGLRNQRKGAADPQDPQDR